MQSSPITHGLRQELELRLTHGRCAYCGARASLGRPLTREHLIPRSKGGRRHDPRIIVPACSRCNHRRGCQELVLFLLSQPRRISALVDHLGSLPPETLRQIDIRVFGEIYAALWVLGESREAGPSARGRLRQLCSGRTVHRRRYAARRLISAVGERVRREPGSAVAEERLVCRIPSASGPDGYLTSAGALAAIELRLIELLAVVWGAGADEVEREMERRAGMRLPAPEQEEWAATAMDDQEGRRARPGPRRLRVDRRRGRPATRRAA